MIIDLGPTIVILPAPMEYEFALQCDIAWERCRLDTKNPSLSWCRMSHNQDPFS